MYLACKTAFSIHSTHMLPKLNITTAKAKQDCIIGADAVCHASFHIADNMTYY